MRIGNRFRRLAAAALLVAGLVVAMTAQAQLGPLDRLVMPGPLSKAHAKYEKDCKSCHVRFSRESQQQLCLGCHKDVAQDVAAGTGFHGRSPAVKAAGGGMACASCHTEHKGRDADIVGLDRAAFDHAQTDFPLLASHAKVECSACHAAGKAFKEAKTECFACHAKDDRHRGNLGRACADCHTETAWKDARFDHTAKTGYTLTGAHANVRCAGCHVEERYASTPKTCISCHAADDKHKGTNGRECQSCHTTAKWSEVRFDHFAASKFALTGGHAGLKCDDCHAGSKFAHAASSRQCSDCHAKDDVHKGVNGPKCADCHRATKWTDVTFDHAKSAHFALNGAHASLKCTDCHVQPAAVVKLGTRCVDCHRKDDPHEGQLGERCESCHAESHFDANVRFDHDLTSFPLLGKHASVKCDGCHATQKFHDAPGRCVDCHAKDDAHAKRLGSDCGLCHNPNGWRRWIFDHAKTGFALDGAHAKADCLDCHRKPLAGAPKLATDCGSCHRGDDVHHGEFGQDCARCHTTTSFAAVRRLQ